MTTPVIRWDRVAREWSATFAGGEIVTCRWLWLLKRFLTDMLRRQREKRDKMLSEKKRPAQFEINKDHPLARGLVISSPNEC